MSTSNISDIFHPVEHAILSDWLGRSRPQYARDIELSDHWEPACAESDDPWAWREAPEGGHIRLRQPEFKDYSEIFNELDNAVARLCLEGAQGGLPQWSATHGDGHDVVARRYDNAPQRTVSLLPRLVVEINWATSGPGYSWPESYLVTFLPYYDVFVVTASRDSAEVTGYLDGAIGWFHKSKDVTTSVEAIVKDYWTYYRDTYEQHRWECVFFEGLISTERAIVLADEVWAPEDDDAADDDSEPTTLSLGRTPPTAPPEYASGGPRPLGSLTQEEVLQLARAWKARQEEAPATAPPEAPSEPGNKSASAIFREQLAEELGLTREEIELGGQI